VYISPRNIPSPRPPKIEFTPEARLDGGLDLLDKEWKIGKNKTSKALNMWYKNGELGKRMGQSYHGEESFIWDDTDTWDDTAVWDDGVHWTDALEATTYATYRYAFEGHIIKHCGTVLYKQSTTTGITSAIYTGLTAVKGSFFKVNGVLYYRQTGNFVSWDGTTASVVTPYVPTVIINRTPTGGGDLSEGYNRIGAGFKNSFNGNGSATVYTLTDTALDATLVTITIGGVARTEGTHFTVNRTAGTVNFGAGTSPHGAPASGTNNVIVTAYKTNTADINAVLDCKYSTTFGGQNNNRVFAGGNGTGVYYWTGISSAGADPTYWEYNNYNVIGDYDEDITGFGKQYDTLCIFKEREIFGVTYSFNGTTGVFNSFPISDYKGCDCPNTIVSINNNLVWLSSDGGVYILVGTSVENQRNVLQISRNVDLWLLAETALTTASSVTFDGKYWLCVGTHVYMWDYFTSPYVDTGNPNKSAEALSWWYFENINAHSFIVDDNTLFHVDRTSGKSVIFQNLLHDFGVAIPALYRLPMRDLGQGVFYFDVLKCFVDVRGDTRTVIGVTYFTSDDLGGIVDPETFEVGSFNLNNFSLPNFTLDSNSIKTTFTLTPNEKNIELFGIEFANNSYGADLNLSNLILEYKIKKEKR
jgi:hypothetical protein